MVLLATLWPLFAGGSTPSSLESVEMVALYNSSGPFGFSETILWWTCSFVMVWLFPFDVSLRRAFVHEVWFGVVVEHLMVVAI